MRTFGLILAAAAVAAVNGAGIKHDDGGNIVITPSDGTTIFMDASVEGGSTSIQMMSAKFGQADVARAELSATVTQQLADAEDKTASTIADIQTEMATQAQEVTDQLVETREQVDADLAAAVETSKNYADNAIENTVTPALTKVASDLVALETKIKKDIDEDIKTTLTIYENILVGTADSLPAANCAAIRATRSGSPDGAYFIKINNKGVQVWCAREGNTMKSLGGDGSSADSSGTSCFSNPLISAFSPADQKKFVNGKEVVCPGNGLSKTNAARTCKEIKINFKDSKNGIYWIHGRNNDFKSAPFQVYCWNTDRDGGGWTMFLRSYYEGHHRPIYAGNGVTDSGDVNDDILQKLGGAYKLDDKKIRAIIGQKNINDGSRTTNNRNMFSYMVDQSAWNDYYASENNEYGIMKKYTARWRFVRFQQMDSSSTAEEFISYLTPKFNGKTAVGDGVLNWKGRPRCGKNYVGGGGGAGISCNGQHNGSPQTSPRGGRGCKKNKSRDRWHGNFHLYMLNTNHDTYFYCCNGPQHSSHRRFAHRWYIRTNDDDKIA